MNIVEWINQNVYHTTSCDKHRRVLGQKCICGKDKCISELSKPIIEHPDVQKLIMKIVILQKQNDLLTLGLLQEKNKVRKLKEGLLEARNIICSGENTTPQAEERTEITEEKPLKEVRQ